MIDLKKFRENPEFYWKKAKDKWVEIDISKFVELDNKVRNLKLQIDELNQKKNKLSKEIPQIQKQWWDASSMIEEVKNIKKELENIQWEYNISYKEFYEIYLDIPNPSLDNVPFWKSDEENQELAKIWKIKDFAFSPKTHWDLLEERWLIDQERAVKVSGSRFLYIRDWLVKLEFALVMWAIDKLSKKWFSPAIPPNLVREDAMLATGFFPADKNQVYNVNPEDDDLHLVWTSEVPLVSQHMNEILSKDELPLRYVWFSPCYRREAWTYWKDTKWFIRLHQFEKVEMVSFVEPSKWEDEHNLILDIEEEIYQELGIPYRKLLICTWDLWAPAAKKYDLEAWFPGIWDYKEITSCSNTTDFQARRANIKFKDNSTNEKDFVYTLNGTTMALGRVMAAIVENYQNEDKTITVPKVLQHYFWAEKI